jgi:4-nitrophenyl phosphatase
MLGMGCGGLWAGVEASLGKEAIVAGKPNGFCWDFLEKNFGIDKSRTVMIGDNLKTDIPFGGRNDIDTLLIMTGVTTWDYLVGPEAKTEIEVMPKYIVKDFNLEL